MPRRSTKPGGSRPRSACTTGASMRCSELRSRAGRAARRVGLALALARVRRRRSGAQVERLLPAARRPARARSRCAGTSPCATSTSPSTSTPTATASSPGARCAPPGRGSRPTRRRASRSTAARFGPASAASSGAATAPMRCCISSSTCTLPTPPAIRYSLFAEVDPTHRGIAKVERPGAAGGALGARPGAGAAVGAAAAGSAASAASGSAAAARGAVALAVPRGGHPPHPRRLRPRAVPALPAAAGGDAAPGRALATGRAAGAGDPAGGRHRHRVHGRAFDHPGARRAQAGVAAVVVHRAGDRGDDRARRASTTCWPVFPVRRVVVDLLSSA